MNPLNPYPIKSSTAPLCQLLIPRDPFYLMTQCPHWPGKQLDHLALLPVLHCNSSGSILSPVADHLPGPILPICFNSLGTPPNRAADPVCLLPGDPFITPFSSPPCLCVSPQYLKTLSTGKLQWPHMAGIQLVESQHSSSIVISSFSASAWKQPADSAPPPTSTPATGDYNSWFRPRVNLAHSCLPF